MRQPAHEPAQPFLRACFALPTEHTPIWIMRQAGRYLPEYRAVREKVGFLDLCKDPDLATEVTLQPIERFGFDAAILFSDILIPAEAMGLALSYPDGPPVLEPAVRSAGDVDRLRVPDPVAEMGFVPEAIRRIRRALAGRAALIGFAGAPFTMASYMVEGMGSKHFANLKGLMYSDPATWETLLGKIADTTAAYLNAQIEAGAEAVQLFDSWGGALSPADFREFAAPYVVQVIQQLRRDDVPVIYFVGEAAHLVEAMLETGADVLGIDWRLPMKEARRRVAGRAAVQGNLDPCALFGPVDDIRRRADGILEEAGPAPGHVFNLGHGILPPTDPEHVAALVEHVHRASRRSW